MYTLALTPIVFNLIFLWYPLLYLTIFNNINLSISPFLDTVVRYL